LRAQPLSGGCTPAGAVLNVVTPQDGFGPYTPEAVNKNFFEVIGTLQPDRQLQQMQCVDFGSTFDPDLYNSMVGLSHQFGSLF